MSDEQTASRKPTTGLWIHLCEHLGGQIGGDGVSPPAGGAQDGSATHTEKTGKQAIPSAWWLSEFVLRIRVTRECGVKRQYDAKGSSIASATSACLLPRIARANGCTKTENKVRDRCRLHYADMHPVEQPLPRRARPAIVRRRP